LTANCILSIDLYYTFLATYRIIFAGEAAAKDRRPTIRKEDFMVGFKVVFAALVV